MNYRITGRIIGLILLIEGAFMMPSVAICIFDGDKTSLKAFLLTLVLIAFVSAILMYICRNAKKEMGARDGLVCVGLSWIVMSIFGCLPFIFSGYIPNVTDAIFEIVSGFTTTGASILKDVESLSRGILFWRSFTHWIGGMGVLVFLLAILPMSDRSGGFTLHLLRAESPGPDVGKLVPRIKKTATILYLIYILLTILNIAFLLFGGMPLFDSLCTAFGCAGTGGFSIKNDSMAGYSPYLQNVCTVFMMLFGVNFSCYYLLLCRRFKDLWKDEELRFYIITALASMAVIAVNISGMYPTLEETVRHAAFQVSSIMTTTGFATTDFDLWPSLSKAILLCLMVIGASAGSTGGGFKCGRVVLLVKSLRRHIRQTLYPQKVQLIRMNGNVVEESVLKNTMAFMGAYVIIVMLSYIILSIDNFSSTTNYAAVLACFNNIGPGLAAVGPTCNYGSYGILSKLVLTADMLAGRLEIFPILVLFSPSTWRKR